MLNVICEHCLSKLPNDNLQEFIRCPVCRTRQQIILFAALTQEPKKGVAAEIVIDDNATCINHPDKAAAILCDCCGAYICKLCEIEIDNQHLCPRCFNNNTDKIVTLNKRTILHDSSALSLALLPILIWPVTCLSAPIAIFYALFYWNKIDTPYKRGKWRFVLACLIATGQLIGWGMMLAMVIGI